MPLSYKCHSLIQLMSVSFQELCVFRYFSHLQILVHSELGAVWQCKAECQLNIWKPVRDKTKKNSFPAWLWWRNTKRRMSARLTFKLLLFKTRPRPWFPCQTQYESPSTGVPHRVNIGAFVVSNRSSLWFDMQLWRCYVKWETRELLAGERSLYVARPRGVL